MILSPGSSRFSALQRAEIAEIRCRRNVGVGGMRFSALQRAEIAEMTIETLLRYIPGDVSVLFNEPKLLKSTLMLTSYSTMSGFSALQRAEIAEIWSMTATKK